MIKLYIEFDEDKNAIINPFGYCDEKLPKIAIACYTKKIIDFVLKKYDGKLMCKVSKTPIYSIKYNNKFFVIFVSPVGAPWATMVLEDLISLGVEKFIYFGSCGVLDETLEYEILIPEKSRREDGTSCHYIKNGKYITMNNKYRDDFIDILKNENYSYQICKTWTIDAPYRETKNKVKKYLMEGIKCVEMESSALAAIGQFRNIDVFIFFYAADKLKEDKWDKRCLGNEEINKKNYLAILSLKLAYRMAGELNEN